MLRVMARAARRAGAADGVLPREATKPSRLRTSSANESPPNLRRASEASTSAIIVSATTPMAGTAVTSVRSRKLTVDSLVTTSTVSRTGRLRVASGFMATRATIRAPLEIPPSIPPARSVGRTYPSLRIVGDGVVRVRAAPRRVVPPIADLDGLDGLDAHERLGQEGVELAVPVHVAAQADRDAVGENLGHAAERVAHLGGGLDGGDHRRLGRGIEAADRARVDPVQVARPRARAPGRRGGLAQADDVADHASPRGGRGGAWPASRRRRAPPSPEPTPARGRHARRRTRTSTCPGGRRDRDGAG